MNLPREKERVGKYYPSPMTSWSQEAKLWDPTQEGQHLGSNNAMASRVCLVSFHRSHTATVRSQVENPTVSRVDNEYSQPPRNSHLSAYPGELRGGGWGCWGRREQAKR